MGPFYKEAFLFDDVLPADIFFIHRERLPMKKEKKKPGANALTLKGRKLKSKQWNEGDDEVVWPHTPAVIGGE